MRKIKAAFFNNGSDGADPDKVIRRVFADDRKERLERLADFHPEIITTDNFEKQIDRISDIEVIFSTWGMPPLTVEQLKALPHLKAVFYAAGATRYFRGPFIKRGITVCSARAANAIPVAEFALAQILLSGAGYWRNSREYMDSESALSKSTVRERGNFGSSFRGHGNYGGRVALLGNGAISAKLQEFLAPHDLEVLVVPSREMNRTVSIKEAFATSFAVVNLFPDRDDNVGIFNRSLFSALMDGAVFINVGRGRQVNESDLIDVMKERPDLTALLDVQWPEPPEEGSALYTTPNIVLSGHLAGSKADELVRMADYMIEEFVRFEKGEPLLYQVKDDSL